LPSERYIGLMSGTSVDGVDAVLVDFGVAPWRIRARRHLAFDPPLRAELEALQKPGTDELHRAALAANALMDCCAIAVSGVLADAGLDFSDVAAIGLHGQTVRHRPDLQFTTQLANPARLAEACRMAVVADFRSRDVAAGGQGAPLAPGLHAALFRDAARHRVVLNIGGIANITDLPPEGSVRGFDTGPGNTLLDAWCARHRGEAFDRDGAWAATGRPIAALLEALRADPYFALPPPKSTGRDHFNLRWVESRLQTSYAPADVQRSLLALTSATIADAVMRHCPGASEVVVCGGGAHNVALLRELARDLGGRALATTEAYGVPVGDVEALAFAWLARESLAGRPGNLPAVTGARGARVLGAVYPA
jgi:anhydro-N-acetylmuramic acid kinase